MHNVIHAIAAGASGRSAHRRARCLGRLLTASVLVLLTATPALAQAAAPSRTGSILNILLLVLIAYFLVRAFRRRSGGNDDDRTRPGRWSRPDYPDKPGDEDGSGETRPDVRSDDGTAQRPEARTMDRHEAARRTWDMLGSREPGQRPEPTTPTGTPTGSSLRADGFDEAEFLEGAKVLFSRFQQARDKEDYDDLRDFLSDGVYSDAVAAGERPRTEVMLVSALLTELHSDNGRTTASVHYDAQLRVGEEGRPVRYRAVWEFDRDDTTPGGLWVLERINSIDQ
ncbi:hypothetical protein DND132_0677 [Pseudodesulfovibrio mercurii]|uniref:Tim44-like domain-containing protein n=1 Tax=Pseudodesulfovibrio mercurii TaxID=641491 RepID=F0JGM3_9BACT|nr:TIM44-like domain-containing protein [Pseudodesulfovibrio mercurii]EGB13892.1 hypothetical protein DND132_0677 [Pseudodesulfovibrio mercurii]